MAGLRYRALRLGGRALWDVYRRFIHQLDYEGKEMPVLFAKRGVCV